MSTNRPAASVRSRTALHEGFLKMYRYTFEIRKHDGGTHEVEWELMERGNSVGVLAYDPHRDEVVLGNEFRPGALVTGEPPFRDQLIAGVLEAGESAPEAATREMREETGLALREPVIIHPGAYASSGGTTEKIALVFGLVDCGGAAGRIRGADAREDVLTVVVPAELFIEQVLAGEINDCKTLIAGYWFARRWPGLRAGTAA